MSFNPDKIPVWLHRTPEQQAADTALQDRLRQAQGPGRRPNPTEARLIQAAAIKRSAEAQLNNLRLDPDAKLLHIETAEAQLAEALAMEGRYVEAAELHPDLEHAERFQRIAEAIDRDDDAPTCECKVKPEVNELTGKPVIITGEHISEMVFSKKHGRMTPLLVCSGCGGMQVKPTAPQHLQERLDRARQEHTNAKRKI